MHLQEKELNPSCLPDPWEWTERWMDIWTRFMRDPDLRLGAPKKAMGFISGCQGGYREPADEWEAQGNERAVSIINSTLEGMSPAESCAVFHVKLRAVFRFREPADELYLRARQKIGIRLRAADFA